LAIGRKRASRSIFDHYQDVLIAIKAYCDFLSPFHQNSRGTCGPNAPLFFAEGNSGLKACGASWLRPFVCVPMTKVCCPKGNITGKYVIEI
jgi:hypothetical protein